MKTIQLGKITCIPGDCEEYMKDLPDRAFDIAICDPLYGINEADEKRMKSRHKSQSKYKGGDWDKYPPHYHISTDYSE